MTWPLIVLAVPSAAAGWVMGDGMALFNHLGSTEEYITPFAKYVHFLHPHGEAVNMVAMGSGTVLAIVGVALAFMLYGGNKGFEADKAFEKAMPGVYNFSLNRWYMDNVYLGGMSMFLNAFKFIWEIIDRFFVDGIVNSMRWIFYGLGSFLRYSENGRGQSYALIIFASVAILGLVAYYVFVP